MFLFLHEHGGMNELLFSIKRMVADIYLAENVDGILSSDLKYRKEIHVRWVCPKNGWVKCNVDGAFKKVSMMLRCGGVVRDDLGS